MSLACPVPQKLQKSIIYIFYLLNFSESVCKNTRFWKSALSNVTKGADNSPGSSRMEPPAGCLFHPEHFCCKAVNRGLFSGDL